MVAELLSVGTELLLGEILNTDAQYLAAQLSEIGVEVYYQTVVGDNTERLKQAVKQALLRSDIVIASGGLGPTPDDITKEVLSECMGEELVLHKPSLDCMQQYFKRLNRVMGESNKKQAMLPRNGIVMPNHNGTAPGVIIEKNGKIVIMLPGPPNELKPMYMECVKPYLQSKSEYMFYSKCLQIFGMGESAVAEKLKDMMESYTNPTVAPYAKIAGVRLRITAKCKTEAEGAAMIAPVEQEIRAVLGDIIFGENDDELADVVVRAIKENGYHISAAESCTGGLFAKMLTDISGSSAIINDSIITYSNEAKMKYLDVKPETLQQFGAVSEQTAAEMAVGIRKQTGSEIGVGITGIAGPDGGTKEKPVGLVYVGVSIGNTVIVNKLHLVGTRDKIRYSTCIHAFDMVRRQLKS